MDKNSAFEAWFHTEHPPYIDPTKEEVDYHEHKFYICRKAFEFGVSFASNKVPDPSKQEEPKRSLTYAEALECEKVRMYALDKEFLLHKVGFNWDLNQLTWLDLAERRGYRMEKID